MEFEYFAIVAHFHHFSDILTSSKDIFRTIFNFDIVRNSEYISSPSLSSLFPSRYLAEPNPYWLALPSAILVEKNPFHGPALSEN